MDEGCEGPLWMPWRSQLLRPSPSANGCVLLLSGSLGWTAALLSCGLLRLRRDRAACSGTGHARAASPSEPAHQQCSFVSFKILTRTAKSDADTLCLHTRVAIRMRDPSACIRLVEGVTAMWPERPGAVCSVRRAWSSNDAADGWGRSSPSSGGGPRPSSTNTVSSCIHSRWLASAHCWKGHIRCVRMWSADHRADETAPLTLQHPHGKQHPPSSQHGTYERHAPIRPSGTLPGWVSNQA